MSSFSDASVLMYRQPYDVVSTSSQVRHGRRRRRDPCTLLWQPQQHTPHNNAVAVSTSLVVLLVLCNLFQEASSAWQTRIIQHHPRLLQSSTHSSSSSFLGAYRNDDTSSVGGGSGGSSRHEKNNEKTVQTTPTTNDGLVEEAPSIRMDSPAQNEKNVEHTSTTTTNDYTGAGTLGDIMSSPHEEEDGSKSTTVVSSLSSSSSTVPVPNTPTTNTQTTSISIPSTSLSSPTKSGLVTTDGGTLASQFGVTSPLDRMALTANGNLQRLFSSYYDAPVHVLVDYCTLVKTSPSSSEISASQATTTPSSTTTTPATPPPATWDRVVHLMVHNQTFCTATSQITVRDPQCLELVQSGKVGIGQLFRYLDKLPTFTLLDAGLQKDNGALWRVYELRCQELSCRIQEDFVPHAWNISPRVSSPPPSSSSLSSNP